MKLKMHLTAVLDESSFKFSSDILELLRAEPGVEVSEFKLADMDESPAPAPVKRTANPRPWLQDARVVLRPGTNQLDIARTLEKMRVSRGYLQTRAFKRGTLESAVKKAIARSK